MSGTPFPEMPLPRRAGATALGPEALVWEPFRPFLAIASATLGGGMGERRWVVNVEVGRQYAGADPGGDLAAVAAALSLTGDGVGLMTAAPVASVRRLGDAGVVVDATVGLTHPTWAAAPGEVVHAGEPGTVNVVAWVPVRLSDAALVNAVSTVAEAKAQALFDLGVPGTGTASDATVVACPLEGPAEAYGGPRSRWGAPLARAVHGAVLGGARSGEQQA